MASFHDILMEVMDTTFAQEQLKKMEDELQKVLASSQSDPTLAVKTASLNALPQQIKGLKTWLEQQKKITQQNTDEKQEQKQKLGGGVGTQNTLNGQVPAIPAPIAGQQLNPPTQAKPKSIDLLKITNLTKK